MLEFFRELIENIKIRNWAKKEAKKIVIAKTIIKQQEDKQPAVRENL